MALFTVGEVVTAAKLNGIQIELLKSANENVINSTTLQSDDELKFTMAANETWIWEMHVFYTDNSSVTANIKVAMNSPTGSLGSATFWGTGIGSAAVTASTASTNGQYVDGSAYSFDGAGGNLIAKGAIVNGSTAGDVVLRWAQNTLDAGNNTTVQKNSYVLAHRVS